MGADYSLTAGEDQDVPKAFSAFRTPIAPRQLAKYSHQLQICDGSYKSRGAVVVVGNGFKMGAEADSPDGENMGSA
jgi:hypothetical protein